jgi:TRAP-type C4-dicarboxylate transport system permease small subunit
VKSLSNYEDKVLDLTNAILISAMVAAIFLQVVARYLFNYPLAWPEELGRFLFAWIVFLGIVPVLRNDELLGVDLLYRWLPPTAANVFKLMVSTAILIFLLVMLKGGLELMIRQRSQLSVALEVSMSLVYFVIPFSTFLMILAMIFKVIHQARGLFKRGESQEKGRVS